MTPPPPQPKVMIKQQHFSDSRGETSGNLINKVKLAAGMNDRSGNIDRDDDLDDANEFDTQKDQ